MNKLTKNTKKLVSIEKLVYNGYGLGFLDKLTVMVLGALPGDIIQIKPIKKKRFMWLCEIDAIIEPSPLRKEASCQHFKDCGGCQLMDVDYKNQLNLKDTMLEDSFKHLKMLHLKDITKPIQASKSSFYYRNKMDFSFAKEGDQVYLGLKKRKTYNAIVHLSDCQLQSIRCKDILTFSGDFFTSKKSSVWNYETHTGLLRYLTLRESKSRQKYMLILTTSFEDNLLCKAYAKAIQAAFPDIETVWAAIQDSVGDTHKTDKLIHISGTQTFIDHIGDTPFKVSPNAFFQANSETTKQLYDTVIAFAKPKSTDTVLDLYCGTGTIGLSVSSYVKTVIGIDNNEASIADAKENAKLQGVKNALFFTGDARDVLKEQNIFASLLILDPPRSGMHPKAIKEILKIKAPRIVYVSCHPVNMLRDLSLFEENYNVLNIQPIDMFPHTYHMEAVACLEQKSK